MMTDENWRNRALADLVDDWHVAWVGSHSGTDPLTPDPNQTHLVDVKEDHGHRDGQSHLSLKAQQGSRGWSRVIVVEDDLKRAAMLDLLNRSRGRTLADIGKLTLE